MKTGAWFAVQDVDTDFIYVVDDASDEVVASVRDIEDEGEEGETAWKHALLMAAAPDLKDALEDCLHVLMGVSVDEDSVRQALIRSRCAIRKAGG